MSENGLVTIASSSNPSDTIKKLEASIDARGLNLFARIDHAEGAAKVGQNLRPTEVLIFGNAKSGTPLMQANQTIGIDLPLKALVWEDESGKTFISYNDPEWLAKRHGLGSEVMPVVENIRAALDDLVREAAR